MKKISFVLFSSMIAIFMFVSLGHTVQAKGQRHPETQAKLIDTTPDNYWAVTSTQSYTIYLPAIFTPPPPNPKKGVGVTAPPACNDVRSLDASWYFNWSFMPDGTCSAEDKALFVPRLYNASQMPNLNQAIENAKASGWLIGFSEPNLSWQGNMSPAEGAVYWRQIEIAADAAGIKLVSPSPNQWEPGQNGQPYGHQWTWAMVNEYQARYGRNPRFDALGWNIYKGTAGEIQAFLMARRNEALSRGYDDVPFWLLEYGGRCVNGSPAEIQATMQSITPWFDSTPWIGRYAWFANRVSTDGTGVNYGKCTLIDTNSGTKTPLGIIYTTY